MNIARTRNGDGPSQAPPARVARSGQPQDPDRPWPLFAHVGHLRLDGLVVTSIMRRWRPGDAARCRRCPAGHCYADRDICCLTIAEFIPSEAALDYTAMDDRWQDRERPKGFVGRDQ